MRAYLHVRLPTGVPVVLMEESLISHDNIQGMAEEIMRRQASLAPATHRFVYWCDAGRALDAKIHIQHLLPGWEYRVETYDMTPPWDTYKLIPNGRIAWMEHHVPGYLGFRRSMRRRRAGQI